MTLNFPSPLQIKMFYTSRTRPHVTGFYVRPAVGFVPTPGLDPSAYEFLGGDGTTVTDFDSFGALLAYGTGAELTPTTSRGGLVRLLKDPDIVERAELWYFPPQSNDGLFLSAIAYDTLGVSSDVTTPAVGNQLTMTFRTSEGGICRFQVMETATDNTTARYTYATAPNRLKVWINTFLDPTLPLIGKDGGRPIAFLRANMTQNEKIYRKVYRS